MRRYRLQWFVAILALGAISVVFAAEQVAEDDEPLDVETILLENPSPEDYGDLSSCLYGRKYDHVEILDERHMLFEGRRGVWLNRLRGRCMIRSDAILVIERHSSSVCGADRVSGRQRGFPDMIAASCILGDFQEIDPQQALALKESIKLAKQTRRKRAKERKREAKRRQEAS